MTDFTIKKEKHINHIINGFDFEKVHDIMISLNWNWINISALGELEYHIPTIEDLRETALKILNDVYDFDSVDSDDYGYVATGGLKASKYEDFLELEFILTDSSSEEINFEPNYKKLKLSKLRKKKLEKLNKYEDN